MIGVKMDTYVSASSSGRVNLEIVALIISKDGFISKDDGLQIIMSDGVAGGMKPSSSTSLLHSFLTKTMLTGLLK
jgi:hypothetical protein